MNRRSFIASAFSVGTLPHLPPLAAPTPALAEEDSVHPSFPRQDPTLVRAVVARSHGAFDEVKRLVGISRELAKANWDWGFGDWESALGAASHTGRRGIAEFLIEHGARPTIFSAAMLGQVDVVRALLAAHPGLQRNGGPHGITLLQHARAGGAEAALVVELLEELGDADPTETSEPLGAEEADYAGRYAFGADEDQALIVTAEDGALSVMRPGFDARRLRHLGNHVFHPSGAPSVRLRFDPKVSLSVEFGSLGLGMSKD